MESESIAAELAGNDNTQNEAVLGENNEVKGEKTAVGEDELAGNVVDITSNDRELT